MYAFPLCSDGVYPLEAQQLASNKGEWDNAACKVCESYPKGMWVARKQQDVLQSMMV